MKIQKKRKKKQQAPKPLPLPGSIAAYEQEYYKWMAVKNYSQNTIEIRSCYLGYFVKWTEERGLVEPSEITKAVIERYQHYLYHYRKVRTGEPLSFNSQHTRLIPVRAFCKWLSKQNYILYNPAADLEMPRLEKRLPKDILSASEADTVCNVPDVREPVGLRDRAMLETLYNTGMRRMEVIGLKMYDIDFDRGTVLIRQGKGKKDRMTPIGDRALAWIRKYMLEVRPSLVVSPDNGILFLTAQGEAFTRNRLTQMVRNYINASNVGKKGSCHLFRHTCATLMLEGGADIRFIQQLLGHADISTTEIYTQVSIKKLKEIHNLTHPAARLNPEDNPGNPSKAPESSQNPEESTEN